MNEYEKEFKRLLRNKENFFFSYSCSFSYLLILVLEIHSCINATINGLNKNNIVSLKFLQQGVNSQNTKWISSGNESTLPWWQKLSSLLHTIMIFFLLKIKSFTYLYLRVSSAFFLQPFRISSSKKNKT